MHQYLPKFNFVNSDVTDGKKLLCVTSFHLTLQARDFVTLPSWQFACDVMKWQFSSCVTSCRGRIVLGHQRMAQHWCNNMEIQLMCDVIQWHNSTVTSYHGKTDFCDVIEGKKARRISFICHRSVKGLLLPTLDIVRERKKQFINFLWK